MKNSRLARGFETITMVVDQRIGWHRLPRPLGIPLLIGIRGRLRRHNLIDTGRPSDMPAHAPPPVPPQYVRTVDGTYNDRTDTTMGQVGCRFGRNVPLTDTIPEKSHDLLRPSPREVSRRLLTRDRFLAAENVNGLFGAWLQFEVHDWFSHGKNPTDGKWQIPLENDDDWWRDPQRVEPMTIQRTREDETHDPRTDPAPTWRTTQTHWWDASQVYGDTPEMAAALRDSGGRLRLEADGLPSSRLIDALDRADTGGAFWLGLGLLHVLFMQEHNAICSELAAHHPRQDEDWIYHHARLVNSALMAKIHATEWSPALLDHKTTLWGTRIEWWGLAGKWVKDHLGRLGASEDLSGIPGSPTEQHGAPYSLSEEFVAVYRMHQLIADDYEFFSLGNGSPTAKLTFPELGVDHTRTRLEELGMADALYSFGLAHPGQVTLHNFPRFLQRFDRPLRPGDIAEGHDPVVDLAALDILRNRERGVPRYNRFRERFHLRPARSFEDLTANPTWAEEIREVYEGDIDRVDLSIGLYAESLPKGFVISDTAFRVFILMATRRLQSDRFFTVDYRPGIYTAEGLRWVERETLASVLVRHYPELKPALDGVDNAFKPWRPVRR